MTDGERWVDDGDIEVRLSFVECICARPTMYTLSGTFAEVLAYLWGYYEGPRDRAGTWHVEDGKAWHEFCAWLQKRHPAGTFFPGSTVWEIFRAGTKDDREAIARLLQSYCDYRDQDEASTEAQQEPSQL
jgi:hypothetical protein